MAEQIAFRNRETGGWRLVIRGKLKPDAEKPAELRARLVGAEQKAMSEVWTYTEPAS